MSDPSSWTTVWPGPLPIQVMMQAQWDQAFEFLFLHTAADKDALVDGWMTRTKASDDREVTRSAINQLIDVLFERRLVDHALSWSFLAADHTRPETIQSFLPQVHVRFAKAMEEDVYSDEECEIIRETLNVWHAASDGEHIESKVSVFAIAARTIPRTVANAAFKRLRKKFADDLRAQVEDGLRDDTPGLVVMPRNRSSKLKSDHAEFKDLLGKKLPFVDAGDVFQVQAQLRREYPHAWPAIDMLTRDLRDGQPVRLKPTILLGDPGSGKSRLARRLSELLGYETVYRFDASGISDAVAFSGTAKGWGNTTPSVPARAVQQAGKANPWVLIDEIDKAGTGMHNGNFYGSLTPFLERESSKRFRDISLDSELDLSWCSFVATANDDTTIPAHIRDRFRIVRVALPKLEHLRPLARQIMFDLAAEDDVDPRWMAALDADEEAVIAKAWARAGFSIRKLQKIVGGTLDARDAVALRN